MVGIAIAGQSTEGLYVPVKASDERDSLRRLVHALADTATVVAHNSTYEYSVISARVSDLPVHKLRIDDPMIMARLLGRQRIGLKWLMNHEFGVTPAEFTDVVGPEGIEAADPVELARYAIADATGTWQLYKKLRPLLDKEEEELYQLELDLVPAVAHITQQGLDIDTTALKQALRSSSVTEKVLLSQIQQEVFNNTVVEEEPAPLVKDPDRMKPAWFIEGRRVGPPASASYKAAKDWRFNPGSWQQICAYLNIESSRETSLLQEDSAIAHRIVEYKQERKFQTSYATPVLRSVEETGKLYGSFNAVGTDTGRFSASGYKLLDGTTVGVNLQTLPPRIKKVLSVPKGYRLVEFDYSQIELRLLAHISRDPDLLRAYVEDRDIHTETMERAGLSDRRIAKILNFNCSYNPYDGSAAFVVKQAALKDGIRLNRRRCDKLVAAFREAWPGVLEYYDSIELQIQQHRFVSTLLGRSFRCKLVGVPELDKPVFRKAVNHPIQGSGADLLKLALRDLWRSRPLWARIVNTVHDSIWFLVPTAKVDALEEWVRPIMETNYLKLDVPVKVEMEILK